MSTARLPAEWRYLLAGAAGTAITMGVGRFAYTPLLPLMQHDHGLDAVAGSWLAASHFGGYLAGALLAALWLPARRRAAAFIGGLVASVLSSAGMGLSETFTSWMLLRFVSGLGAAAAMVLGGALVLERLPATQRAFGSGLLYGGMALGIVGSTLAINGLAAGGWHAPAIWLACAAACTPLLWCARPLLEAPPSSVAEARTALEARPLHLGWLLLAYACAGYGYSTSATFLPLIVRGLGVGPQISAWVWLLVGLAALPASFAWGWIAARCGSRRALDFAYLVQAAGVGLPLLLPNATGALLSGALFGASFIAVVALALAIAREAEPTRASRVIGLMTSAYGLTQILGPLVSARLIGPHDDFSWPLVLASASLLLGFALLRLAYRRPPLQLLTESA